jgi:hypothetical protein
MVLYCIENTLPIGVSLNGFFQNNPGIQVGTTYTDNHWMFYRRPPLATPFGQGF